MKVIASIVVFLSVLVSTPAFALDLDFPYQLDRTDKILYSTVVVGQVLDGLTTAAHLDRNKNNYIRERWNWKYGNDPRPSPAKLWGVKAVELGLVYGAARCLPSEYRKPFMGVVAVGLFACGVSNGLEFEIAF